MPLALQQQEVLLLVGNALRAHFRPWLHHHHDDACHALESEFARQLEAESTAQIDENVFFGVPADLRLA